MTEHGRRVVILRPLGLGDFLTGMPVYRAIARAFPSHRKILAAPRALEPLARLSGAIDELHETQPLAELDPALHDADVGVDVHGRGPASQRILLRARPRRLISFAHADVPETAGGAGWSAHEHEVVRWCRMLAHAGIPARSDELDLAVPALPPPPGVAGATVVHASAASEARRWPIERWAAIATFERMAGRTVVLTGDAHDIPRVAEIARRAEIPAAHMYAGRTTLLDLAAIVAAAGRIVCSDTGVAHLATAFRRPSVVLFGPISPAEWGPPAERRLHRALWTGRYGDPHGTHLDPGLREISTEMVIAAMLDLPNVGRLSASGPAA